MFPDDLQYTREHEWVRVAGDSVRIGITSYAQEQLGDVVYVSLPAEGAEVEAGQALGEVESTKSVADIYAPVSGTVRSRNEALDAHPELVNTDPYGEGWMVEIAAGAGGLPEGLLDAAAYESFVGEQG